MRTITAKKALAILAFGALVAGLGGCGGGDADEASGGSTAASDEALDTIQPGVLQVAVYDGPPYIGATGGKLTGLDGRLLTLAAQRLGLTIKVNVMDFPGLLSAVQTRRVDIGVGNIGWSAERAKQGRFTDPPFYSPVAMALRPGVQAKTVHDLAGKRVGTLTGGFYTKGLRELKDVTVRTYQSLPAEINDLEAGRIDVVFYDGLGLAALKKQRPELTFSIAYITPPTDAEVKEHPGYSVFRPYMSGWYLASESPKLEKALNEQIRAMYKSGELAKVITEAGADPKEMLVPQPYFAEQRGKTDRDANWQPPSIE